MQSLIAKEDLPRDLDEVDWAEVPSRTLGNVTLTEGGEYYPVYLPANIREQASQPPFSGFLRAPFLVSLLHTQVCVGRANRTQGAWESLSASCYWC